MLVFKGNYEVGSPDANFCVRVNRGNKSPLLDAVWDNDAKCVIDTEARNLGSVGLSVGIHAASTDNLYDLYKCGLIVSWVNDAHILILEYDKSDVVMASSYELCLKKANIIYSGTLEQYKIDNKTGRIRLLEEIFATLKQEIFYMGLWTRLWKRKK